MCTYSTVRVAIDGAAQGRPAWFSVDDAGVYVDHPYHSTAAHTLNLDFRNAGGGPEARVAVELSLDSARRLARAIDEALAGYEEMAGSKR
jgi:hypothetical protein